MFITLFNFQRGKHWMFITLLEFDFNLNRDWAVLDLQWQNKKLIRFELFGINFIKPDLY